MSYLTSNENSSPTDRPPSMVDSEPKGGRSRSSGTAWDDGQLAQDARPADENPMSRLRWIPRLLVLLVFLCLVLAAWVWYQIYRIL